MNQCNYIVLILISYKKYEDTICCFRILIGHTFMEN